MARHGDMLRELREPTKDLRHAIPDTWAGFLGLHDARFAPSIDVADLHHLELHRGERRSALSGGSLLEQAFPDGERDA